MTYRIFNGLNFLNGHNFINYTFPSELFMKVYADIASYGETSTSVVPWNNLLAIGFHLYLSF